MPDNNLVVETVEKEDPNAHPTIRVSANADLTKQSPKPDLSSEPRPQWLPENFKTPEALVAAQKEAQAKITKLSQELAALRNQTAPTSAPPVAPQATQESAATPSVPPAAPATLGPLDLAAMSAEYLANAGKLTEQSLKTLAERGIPAEVVGSYLQGQQALAEKVAASLARVAGGEDQLKMVLEWTAANNQEAGRAYNKAFAEGREDDLKLILGGMRREYEQRVGRDPRVFIRGETTQSRAAEQPFLTFAEASLAMKDARYKTDEAYRRSVYRRMENLKR